MLLQMNRHLNFHGKVKRYNHNLSYRNFFSGEIGELRPVYLEDMVPGDTFQYKPELRLYFAPLVFPVLASMKARVDLWFVPNRLAWKQWENFITGGPENNLSPAYPSLRNVWAAVQQGTTVNEFVNFYQNNVTSYRSLLNNLGHPSDTNYSSTDLPNDPYDMIPTWDYLCIWDEGYRDEEKEGMITAPNGIRLDVFELFSDYNAITAANNLLPNGEIPHIAWAKDYFTTASLEQQRGGDIPLLSNPMFKFVDGSAYNTAQQAIQFQGTSSTLTEPGGLTATNYTGSQRPLESVLTINGVYFLKSAAKFLNNNVVGGTRYVEQLRTRYRVISSDARLQRPEMIGSVSLPVNIDVVTQTSSTVDDGVDIFPLGDRAGKASVIGSGKMLTYSAEEFGYLIAILHVAPKASYFQGIRRNLQREDKFDFFMPEFVHVPQREIRNNEIYADSAHMSPETGGVFGYSGQYNEYRHHNDEVHGDFQNSLLSWTMARKFSSLPSAASSAFLRVDNSPQGNNRIFAVPDAQNHIFGVVSNICTALREIPNYEPQF